MIKFAISISKQCRIYSPLWIDFATSICLEIAAPTAAHFFFFLKKAGTSLRITGAGLILSQLKEVVKMLAMPRLSVGKGIHM